MSVLGHAIFSPYVRQLYSMRKKVNGFVDGAAPKKLHTLDDFAIKGR